MTSAPDGDPRRVLVTGGAGFIGSHIVELLIHGGHEVVVLDSLDPEVHPHPPVVHPDAELVVGDVTDPDAWRRSASGIDAVCHQAARVGLENGFGDAHRYVADNDTGTASGLRALHEIGFAGRFVLASSMVVYGEGGYRCATHGRVRPGPRRADDLDAGRYEPPCPQCGAALTWAAVTEDAPLDPRNVYAATKVHQEHLCAAYGRQHSSTVTSLRYHNVYGPRMPRDTPYAGVAALFRSAVARGDAPQVFEDGGQLRDFVHVDDVAAANVAALTSPGPVDGPLNIASGDPRSVLDLAAAACGTTGLVPDIVGGGRLGDVRHIVASPQRARDALGFEATVRFADGMRAFATAPLRGD